MYMPCPGLAVNATQLINELELLTVQRAMHASTTSSILSEGICQSQGLDV